MTLYTTEEALKVIRRAPSGTSFRLHVHIDMPIPGTDRLYRDAASGYTSLSRAAALDLVRNVRNRAAEEAGGRLSLSWYGESLWIGGSE